MKIEIEINKQDLRTTADILAKIILSAQKQEEVLPLKKILIQLINKL